jgi:hypothetical protein
MLRKAKTAMLFSPKRVSARGRSWNKRLVAGENGTGSGRECEQSGRGKWRKRRRKGSENDGEARELNFGAEKVRGRSLYYVVDKMS